MCTINWKITLDRQRQSVDPVVLAASFQDSAMQYVIASFDIWIITVLRT